MSYVAASFAPPRDRPLSMRARLKGFARRVDLPFVGALAGIAVVVLLFLWLY